eukprot:COSAG01_NODE_13694_length_1547_cov_1.261740_3_plen_61_part_00
MGLEALLDADPELRAVPEVYFSPEFSLTEPATFAQVCAGHAAPLRRPHEGMALQVRAAAL